MKDSTITTIDTSNLEDSIVSEDMEASNIIESIVKQLKSGNEAAAIELIVANAQHINTPYAITGETLLHYAAGYGRTEATDTLLANDPELLYVSNPSGSYPIHYAVVNDNAEIVEHMMNINPLVITLEDGIQDNPLHTAARFGHPGLLKLLLNTDESDQEPIVGSDGNTYYDDNVMLSIHVAELQNEFGERYYDYLDNVEEMNLVSFFSV